MPDDPLSFTEEDFLSCLLELGGYPITPTTYVCPVCKWSTAHGFGRVADLRTNIITANSFCAAYGEWFDKMRNRHG
jgi:hypothetical protein